MRGITGSMVLFWGAASIGNASLGQPINHPVISELRFFEHKDVNEEFVELYNPTVKEIPLNKWKLAYKKKTGGEWRIKAVFGPDHAIPPHGFFLWGGDKVALQPDAVESSRYSINFSGTGGHVALRDSSDRVVDLAAWGGGDSPEGNSIPGPFIEGGSVERKANGSSTVLSMIPQGADATAGNGFDTDDNRSDFILHNHFAETNPQNVSAPREPEWTEPQGSGSCSVRPGTVSILDTVSLRFTVRSDNDSRFSELIIRIPDGWGWTFRPGGVGLDGGCFRNSGVTVSGDTVRIAGLDLAAQDSGVVTLMSMVAPAEAGSSEFPVFSSGSGEGFSPIRGSTTVFVTAEAVPIALLHRNDGQGMPLSPFGAGTRVMISGKVTAGYGTFTTGQIFVQDATAAIAMYSTPFPVQPATGDSVTVKGTIGQFRGMTGISPDWLTLTVHGHGRPLPEPKDMTCAQVGRAFLADGSEPDEGRLIRIRGGTVDAGSGTISDETGAAILFSDSGDGISMPSGIFDVTGILTQVKPGADEAPYTTDYGIAPRSRSDLVHPDRSGLGGFPEAIRTDLFQNCPNPFNQETMIRYRIPGAGSVRIAVFDLLGREVSVIISKRQAAGIHTARWNGKDDAGRPLPTGIYLIRLRTETGIKTLKCLLLR